jgi:hypothetical protein
MSEGPRAVGPIPPNDPLPPTHPLPPDGDRCPHIHKTAANRPTTRNPDPKCNGRCVFYAGHPGGNRDHPGWSRNADYAGRNCLCEVCRLWVRDWAPHG